MSSLCLSTTIPESSAAGKIFWRKADTQRGRAVSVKSRSADESQ